MTPAEKKALDDVLDRIESLEDAADTARANLANANAALKDTVATLQAKLDAAPDSVDGQPELDRLTAIVEHLNALGQSVNDGSAAVAATAVETLKGPDTTTTAPGNV